ncbi:NEK5 [Symbiodinium pilosum]|uniref:non-specific serine/threonine protein kinase n=1 Tax=Symbiodinium pilosum TaxID=2952 RepID=A0A812VBJ0_SYMPI|nr:NEK5 [Symbiodinium pilosum]
MEDFEELRHLGRGAFGEVLLMRQTSTGLLCAVKKLGRTALPAGEEAEHLAEVKVLQTLTHPCILRYYGSIQLDESLSLVMEFADSGDLQQLLKKQMDSEKLFEVAALFAIFSQLVVAVAHVHGHRVLHRDLKPSNVMLTSGGLLKLGDFGVAKVMAGTTMVDNMTCVGSPTYMAPEIVAGEAYGAPCDVWSLGVILYELASFKRPFEGRSLGELIMRISSGKFESIGAHLAQKPGGHVLEDAVSPVLAKMLVVDPKGRGRMTEVMRAPSVQVFVASLKTSAVIVASIIQELEDPQKAKAIDVNTAAVDELIAELAAKSPKRAEAAENLPKAGQVRSSLAAKAEKKVVEDDSLAFSLTSSEIGTAVSDRLAAKIPASDGSGEVSFNLTATDALQISKKVPVLNEDTHEAVKAVSQKFGQRSGGLGVSDDNHALRDVLGDALDLGGTSPPEDRHSKSQSGTLPRSNSNTSTQKRSSQPMHGTRDLAEAVLRDAMGAEVSSQTGRLQSTSGTDVAEGEAGSVHFDHVTPGWKVKSSSRRQSDSSSSSPPASREQRRVPITTRDQPAHPEVSRCPNEMLELRLCVLPARCQGRQIGFWKKSTSAVVPFDAETLSSGRSEAVSALVKPLTPDVRSKLGSTSNSTACSDDAARLFGTCSYATGSADVSPDPPASPIATPEDLSHEPSSRENVVIYAAVAAEPFGTQCSERRLPPAFSLPNGTRDCEAYNRSLAADKISAVLNGCDLEGMAPPGSTSALTKGERAAAWRVSCLVLNLVLRDKVIPVSLAALELFRDTFQNIDVNLSSAQVQHAAAVLIEHVMSRIGDSNVRLHEGARRDLVFAASRQLLGIGGMLGRLQQRLETAPARGGERNKVQFGVLDTVAEIIRSYSESSSNGPPGPHTWSVDTISSFVTAGMEESLGPRVRNSALALAATVYRLRGPKIADALVAGLRPAKQTLLRQKFQEIDEEGNSFAAEEDSDGGEVRPDLDNCLQVCSALPALPGLVTGGGEEESLMDGILEETGLVFNGAGIQNELERRRSVRKSVSFCQQDDIVEVEQHQDEELLLDHEAWALGIDVEEIDEQEALLREILMGSEDEDEDESPRTPLYDHRFETLAVDAC